MSTPNTPAETVVILGVTESDAHAVANHLIAAHLRAHDFTVVNLGVCTPLSEFADAFDQHPEAVAVLIGSLNGHVHEDLRDLPGLRAAGRLGCPVIVGGNLSVGSHKSEQDHERLLALGVDHIVSDPNSLPVLLDTLTSAGARLAGRN